MYALSFGIAFEDFERARCHMHIRRLFEITAWAIASVQVEGELVGIVSVAGSLSKIRSANRLRVNPSR